MPQRLKNGKNVRPPRIRVPNSERALFTVDARKLVGVIQRLSITGGSVVLSAGPIPQGTLAEMKLHTVFGIATARIEFLRTGADGIGTAQAFRILDMDKASSKRFDAAASQMQSSGFGDVDGKGNALGNLASKSLSKLRESIRHFRK